MRGNSVSPQRADLPRRRTLADDSGVMAAVFALIIVVLLGMAALALDIARWYVEGQKLQRTADAAALAGAVYLPTQPTDAKSKARDLIQANGYSAAVASAAIIDQVASRPSQLTVTVSNRVRSFFGQVLGIGSKSITRTGIGDYTAAPAMGSPCPTFGNNPPSTGSQTSPDGLAQCSNRPQFWASVYGPLVDKTQGDRFATRKCGPDSRESYCDSSNDVNTEFNPQGYVMIVRVRSTGSPVTLQLYDPAYVETGADCGKIPNGFGDPYHDDWEYSSGNPNPYCSGDDDNRTLSWSPNGSGNPSLRNDQDSREIPTVTSFGLIEPTTSLNPYDSDANTHRVAGCSAQFRGYSLYTDGTDVWKTGDGTSTTLTNAPGGSDKSSQLSATSSFTNVFHKWVTLCTFTPTRVGDYYLRVRTNVALGNPNGVFTQTGDDTSMRGNGGNRFGVRSTNTDVVVAAFEQMPIFANSRANSAEFNLLQVTPASAGRTMRFTFFDVGDAVDSGGGATVQILPPHDAKVLPSGASLTSLSGCSSVGPFKNLGSLTHCAINGILNRDSSGDYSNSWNGKVQTIDVPIPPNYTCTEVKPSPPAAPNTLESRGCWFRVKITFPAGSSVTDQTTWQAVLEGDPVRLVK